MDPETNGEMNGVVDIVQLFRQEYPRLVRALTVSFGAEVAAEAVQEAFLQADRHWRRVAGYDDPAVWIRRVAINRARNLQRGARRRHARDTPSGEGVQRPLTDELLDLRRAIDALPERMGLVVSLHYLAGLSVGEVAEALDIAPGTVKSTLYDARHKLQIELSEDRHA